MNAATPLYQSIAQYALKSGHPLPGLVCIRFLEEGGVDTRELVSEVVSRCASGSDTGQAARLSLPANDASVPPPPAERGAQLMVAQVRAPSRQRRRSDRPGRRHPLGPRDRVIDEHGSGEIERGKEMEIGREAQVVSDRGRNHPTEQIARDVAGNVCSKGSARIGRAALLAQIGQHQRER